MTNNSTANGGENSEDLFQKIFLTELSNIDENIARYDTHSLIIKGWAISIWAGLTYFAIRESIYALFLVQIILLLVFWSFDGLYKFYQRRFTIRSDKIFQFFQEYQIKKKGNRLIFGRKGEDPEVDGDQSHEDSSNEFLPLVIHREENPMNIDNNDDDFTKKKEKEKKLKSLSRSLVLRAVSVVYLYLIASSYLIALFIILPENIQLGKFIFGFSLEIFAFAIFNCIYGYDKAISGKINGKSCCFKWVFNLFRWITIILIGVNSILLLMIIYEKVIIS